MQELNKDLMASSLAPMVLLILKRQESYGYEIIQQLKDKTGGELAVAEGTLYPVLKKMEEKQWLQSSWKKADTGRERKYYAITEKGTRELEEQLSQWNYVNNLITKLWKPEISI
ncbi:PadR family transcriptional regulator [Mucilaginibacter sp. HD30]